MEQVVTLPGEPGAFGQLTKRELWQPKQEMLRASAGVGLASIYGLALGARAGGVSLLRHAGGAPLALVLLSVGLVPALFVVLALIDSPVTPAQLLSSAARALAATGLVLASVAPATAMLVVTILDPEAAGLIAWLGIGLAGGIGLLAFWSSMREHLTRASGGVMAKAYLSLFIFCALSVALSVRAFGALLPLLAGAS